MLLALNGPSLKRFAGCVSPGGLILFNSSIITTPPGRQDVTSLFVPAGELGNIRVANNILLGAMVALTEMVSKGAVLHTLRKVYPQKLVDINISAIEAGGLFAASRSDPQIKRTK